MTKLQRAFTAREREVIRRDWRYRPVAEIAAALGRAPKDVHEAAIRFGVHVPSRRLRPVTPATKQRVVELHGRGLSNREIGRRLGRSHVSVGRVLAEIGLRSNCRVSNRERFPARWRELIGRKIRERIRRDGLFTAMACLRRLLPQRAAAIRLGWPQVGTLLEARILAHLHRCGPTTADALTGMAGRRRNWTGQVVRDLRNRGLVAVRGRSGKHCLYGLADGVAPVGVDPPAKSEGGVS